MENYVPLVPLPDRIGRLNELAYDLWWSWNDPARELFRALDDRLWNFTSHNPVLLLHLLTPARVAEAAVDPDFLARYDAAIACYDAACSSTRTWWDQRAPDAPAAVIAYFSAEFALDRRCRSTLAASACWRATISRKPAISASRWSRSA